MNKPLKIVKIGNSAGVILPKELLSELGAGVGDVLHATHAAEGVTLVRQDVDFAHQLEAAREVMARRRRALRELAK